MLNLLCLLLALIPTLENGRIAPLVEDIGKAHVIPTHEGWITLDEVTPETQTLYSSDIFERILKGDFSALEEGYRELEGKPLTRSRSKTLSYPSIQKLKVEHFFTKMPLLPILFGIYLLAALTRKRFIFIAALTLHTLLLIGRCYILSRPPVSNMMETILYVPWIAALTALFSKHTFAGSLSATALLLFLPPHQTFETVQAVLDSSYWLTIHVLLIVGSYGILIFSGILAHFYLLRANYFDTLLKTLYIGTALLIVGTMLGGVWAAQSWGRFWDWDPKEAWAFISALIYLAFLHAYKFRKITKRTLAVGSIIGLLTISFTWYGVNYILGTGLHSYGFGGGGEWIYYCYIGAEIAFLLLSRQINKIFHR